METDNSPNVKIPILESKSDCSDNMYVAAQGFSNGEVRRMQDVGSNVAHEDKDWNAHFSCCEKVFIFFANLLTCVIPMFWCCLFKTVNEYERALIFRLGKLRARAAGPGLFTINPILDSILVIDMRVQTLDLEPQAMMTKDSVTVNVDAVVFMKVNDPQRAVLEVDDYHHAFRNFAATTLRNVVGTFDLEQVLCERDIINETMRKIIEDETSNWGVRVPAVEIKDVKLPPNMQRAMAAEAEAERERRAKVISATGEAQAAVKLAEAANVIGDSPGALQLRYLHTLVKISAEKNSTILFPLPMEVMRGIKTFSDAMEVQQNINQAKK